MLEALQTIEQEALQKIASIQNAAELEDWRIGYIARTGQFTKLLEDLKNVPPAQRPVVGKEANRIKQILQAAWEEKREAYTTQAAALPEDPTLPGLPQTPGRLHLIRQTMDEMITIFRRMGFALADGPEIETEWNNFDALNTPPDHPARNEQDTFYLNLPDDPKQGRLLLRTQTSPVQIRTMMKQAPPLKIIAPGRCYRRDEVDATHGMFFHQVEGLVVDRGIHLGHLKGTLEHFFRQLVGPEINVRFRPHFFPFTEPSFEADMGRPGLKIRGKEWVEIAGCGMVDPAVLTAVGIDPEEYTGFAFGMGVERLAMMRHEIPDLRLFYDNDLRFLHQF
ncbi:MAG: phenylalanine--tRNA ligase subunit alpha [Candidatus Methylacidiphilales bacterium]